MTERTYRLETEQGLSKGYTLRRLQEKHAAGVVNADIRCTADDGDTWVSLATLIEAGDKIQPDAEQPRSAATADPVDSESATIAQSETAVEMSPDAGDDTDQSLRSQSRKLRRLPAGNGNGKMAKLKAARDQKKAGVISSPDDLIGITLAGDRYTIVDKLGKGSMAYVLRASDSRLQTDVVVKVPKPEKMTDPDIRERFRRESQLLVQLTHPHVVKVLDVGEYKDLPYVVMQYLSEGTLTDRIQKESDGTKGMSPESLKVWLREVARALDFCYRKGMVHRDVKPANILFDEDENAYVSDFGLTKIMYGDHDNIDPSDTASGIVLGTPNYISPEIVLGKEYDGRADQYSLGITVYHALYGKAPMQGDNATATMINQTQKQLQLLSDFRSDVPRELALAVRRSIEKDPKKRFATCEEFADAVIEGLRGPIDSKNTSSSESSTRVRAEQSSQSSTRRRRPGKKSRNRSGRSGRMDAMAQPAGSETDMDWLDLANEPADDLLPPRKGQQKSSKSKKGKKGKSGGTMILGQEVHPGLIIGLGVGIILLVLSIIIRWALSDSRPDVSVELEAVTPEQARELYGGQPNGNNSSPGGNNQPASQNGGGNNNRASQDSNGASQNGSGNQINGNEQTAQPADPQNALANGNAVPSAPAMDNAPDPENGAAVTEPGTISNAVFTSPTDTSTVVAASAVGGPANMKDADAANALSAGSDRTSSNTGTSGARERIPFTVGDQITVGPPGCPVMVVGQQVWNKSEHSVVATLDGTRERDVLAALSPDGKYFAAAARHPNQQNTNVDVWETDTGRKLFTAAGTSGRYADAILLAPRSLYVGGRWSADLQRWNCANGNKAKAIPLTSASFRSSNTAVTSDGKYIAAVSNGRLGILQTTGGKIGGVMQSPENRPRASLRASAPTTAPDPGNERVYESLQCLRFSMDNAELAGVATFPVPRILCWESTGKLIVDRPFSGSANVARFNQLEWFSDGNAWLIAGNIIDRETGHILLASDEAFPNSVHIYDQSRLCGVFASNDSELLIREIPWDQIQGALAEVSNPDSALVSPAKPVSLHVSLDGRSNLESHVTRAMTKRLTADGIKIDDTTHDVAFRVQGDSATSQLTCELVIHGQSRWSALIPDVQALTTEFDSADTVQQKAMLDYVAEKIGGLAVPWFVPANDDLVMLPVALN